MKILKFCAIIFIFVALSFCFVSFQKRNTQNRNLKSKIGQAVTMKYSIAVGKDFTEYQIEGKQLLYFVDVFCNKTVEGKAIKGAPFMSFTFVKPNGNVTKLSLFLIDKERFRLQGDINDDLTYYGDLKVEVVKDIVLKLDSTDHRLTNEILSCKVLKVMPYSLIDFSKWNN